MPIVSVEKPLRDKLGDEATDSLVHLINQAQNDQKKDVLTFLEEKFERRLSDFGERHFGFRIAGEAFRISDCGFRIEKNLN